MTMHHFNLQVAHPSWQPCLQRGLARMDEKYLNQLNQSTDWLPGPKNIFNAFSLPLENVNYILFGESPYPRRESANGFAFWDASVQQLWSETGLSKPVNRATSLRNLVKMLLLAEGELDQHHLQQDDIAKIDKRKFVQTNKEFFTNFLTHGFLLLNATPVLQVTAPGKDARAWLPFTQELLRCLLERRPHVKFILLGRIANHINQLIDHPDLEKLCAEHPYNHSFITNPAVITFFRPLHLLRKGT